MIAYTLLGYLSGSVMYAYLVPLLCCGRDVRTAGMDANPGAANAAKACGLSMGFLCVLLDMLKAFIPIALSRRAGLTMGWMLVPVVMAPVLGHAFPIFLRGRGGKAIAASFGALIALLPQEPAAAVWAALLLFLLPFVHSHALLITLSALLLAAGSFVYSSNPAVRCAVAGISAILTYKQRREVGRLWQEMHARKWRGNL